MRRLTLSIVLFAFGTRGGAAQEAPQSKLKPADASVQLVRPGGGYGVRELSDGRVLYQDYPRMVIADMKSARTDSVPDMPADNPVAFAADTTLVRMSGSWVFAKGTKVLGMLDATNPVVAIAARSLIGADANGFVVALRSYGADSNDVLRVNRTTAEVEVLVRIKRNRGVPGGVPAPMYNGIKEHAVYTLDGWLGIQRTAPYRVDWRSPEGKWTLGKPIPVPVIRFDDREKLAYATEQARLEGDSIARILGRMKEWADAVEPSYGGSPMATSDGKMLVYRTPTADFPNARYDVVNREGVAERQILMGPDEIIVGFGAKSVFVKTRAPRFAGRLERHPWP